MIATVDTNIHGGVSDQSLQQLLRAVLPQISLAVRGDRYARKAVNDLYRALGDTPPHQKRRDQRQRRRHLVPDT